MGLRGGNRRQRKAPPKRRKRIPRRNGIPANPHQNGISEDMLPDFEESSEEEEPDLVPFEDQDDEMVDDGSFRDGKITNYGGQRPQQPQ